MKGWHVILVIFLMSGICSCGSQIKYVPVENIRIDTLCKYTVQVDSILQKDSIYIVDRGDTVVEYRYKCLYRFRDRIDTLYLSRTDSIAVPYPVEKQLSKWQQTKVSYGGWAIGIVFIIVLIVVGRQVYRLRN